MNRSLARPLWKVSAWCSIHSSAASFPCACCWYNSKRMAFAMKEDDALERFIGLGIRLFKLCLVWVLIALVVGVAVVTIWPPARPELGSVWLPLPGFTRIRFGVGLVWRTENGPIGIGL